jgi:hypothetical protein
MITTQHPEWGDTKKWIEARIAACHLAMETAAPGEVAVLQGKLAAYRDFLDAAEPRIAAPKSSTDYS